MGSGEGDAVFSGVGVNVIVGDGDGVGDTSVLVTTKMVGVLVGYSVAVAISVAVDVLVGIEVAVGVAVGVGSGWLASNGEINHAAKTNTIKPTSAIT